MANGFGKSTENPILLCLFDPSRVGCYTQYERSFKGGWRLQEKVLQAASRLFAERGFYATGMRAIAAAAKVSVGTIYNHFQTKEEILEAILCDEVERRSKFLQEVAKEKLPLVKKVEKLVAFHFSLLEERRDASLLFFRERFDPNPGIRRRLEKLYDGLANQIAALLQDGVREGEIVPYSCLDAAYILLGMMEAVSLRALRDDRVAASIREEAPKELTRAIWAWLKGSPTEIPA